MPNKDRMFQVIVLGGMALGAASALAAPGCSSSETPGQNGASNGTEAGDDLGISVEMEASFVDAGQDQSAYDVGFPDEGARVYPIDAGSDADGFPQEGPDAPAPPVDAGQDAMDAPPDSPENG